MISGVVTSQAGTGFDRQIARPCGAFHVNQEMSTGKTKATKQLDEKTGFSTDRHLEFARRVDEAASWQPARRRPTGLCPLHLLVNFDDWKGRVGLTPQTG
jgi:hypothetical protein